MSRTKGKPDHFARQARREGYPARSVYKLQELHEKHGLIERTDAVLDLGAAPGSWSKFALEIVGAQGRVVAVDLSRVTLQVKPGNDFCFLEGDFFDPEITSRLSSLGPYDVVLSDAAPSTTGNALVDTARSFEIAERALSIGYKTLKPGGRLLVKLFQGGGERDFVGTARALFQTVRVCKPKASASNSREVYILGLGRRRST